MGLIRKKDHRHPDPKVRLRAIDDLTDKSMLVEVACTDDSSRVRMAAVTRLDEDDLLAEIAKDASEIDVRIAAVERISSERLLADIIKARKNYELMGACFARITNTMVLQAIAEDPGYNPTARRIAVDQFADESYLEDMSEDAGGEKGEGPDEETVDRLLSAYGDLRVIRAIGRFRNSKKALKALGAIARRGGEPGGLAVEYLGRALGSANPSVCEDAADQLVGLSDPEIVASLVRMLDDPKVREPIRGVLERIDTPEARQALGQAQE